MTDHELDDDELEELAERRAVWQLVDEAFKSFAAVPQPLVDGDHPLADDVQRVLGGKRWDEIGPDELRAVRLDLRWLTPHAFWYVFRAIARHVLVGTKPVDGLAEATVAVLTPAKGDSGADVRERRGLLDTAQRLAVHAFVSWHAAGETHLPERDVLLAAWEDPSQRS